MARCRLTADQEQLAGRCCAALPRRDLCDLETVVAHSQSVAHLIPKNEEACQR
jgi:hypothetical protein